jgi:hypothetical protein
MHDSAVCAVPQLSGSQLCFRIGLARKRTTLYPLDSMDFIMMDLERPDLCTRHAHWCTGDLTGRLLEFLSCAEGVDGQSDPRLSQLFERILRTRRPSGLFGRYAGQPRNAPPESDAFSGADRLFPGLLRYYDLTGDWRALDAAVGLGERILSVRDEWHKRIEQPALNPIANWVTEAFARLYRVTRDTRYLDFPQLINEHLVHCQNVHSHGFMSTLRGLQLLTMYSGDLGWNEKPEFYRRKIAAEHYERPDGCVAEVFPRNFRTEGCSIADWLMLNLNAGLIMGDDAAYDKAENILYNALFFNQFVTGGFGHRDLIPNGYAIGGLSEAWWCCVHEAGMAMSEYARHAVTYRDGVVRINMLVPGHFTVPRADGAEVEVTIRTNYPATAEAVIDIRKAAPVTEMHVRIPSSIHGAEMTRGTDSGGVHITLRGRVGHRIVPCLEGVLLKYGPLVLAPSAYYWSMQHEVVAGSAPEGYIPPSLPAGIPSLAVGQLADADGWLRLPHEPLPEWSYFEEGLGARLAVGDAAVNVPLQFSGGERRTLRFWPLCYNTCNLTYYETPIAFAGVCD